MRAVVVQPQASALTGRWIVFILSVGKFWPLISGLKCVRWCLRLKALAVVVREEGSF